MKPYFTSLTVLVAACATVATVASGASAAPATPAAPASASAGAQPSPSAEPIRLDAFHVEAEAENDHMVQGPFLPDVQGVKINVGKKTTIIDLDALPRNSGNNYRQALAQAPGLVVSEETSPLLSIGYRGLNPARVQFMQVLKDGIPIHADQFGYPEAYYSPPLDTVDRIEFVRGGAALMYGPQPGGALNYVTHRPRTDRTASGETLHILGDDNFYSTFSYLDGTVGRVGYYGYYNHRETDGFRSANSDVQLDAWLGRAVVDADSASRWIITAESYQEEHGEPGGLTFSTAANAVNYNTSRHTASRLHDRFNLRRRAAALVWERDLPNGTVATRFWANDYVRGSKRQNGGGFGTLPGGAAANTNAIERQAFFTYGAESRVRLDWGRNQRQVFTAGAQLFRTNSPRTDSRGAIADADNGAILTRAKRFSTYAPVFAENLFRFGPLSLTPGVRLENIRQKVSESVNVAKTAAGTPLSSVANRETVPLFGLGAAYALAGREIYLNISQSYRPILFTQAVPTGGTTLVPADLEESRATNFEVGTRGRPFIGFTYDASAFYLDFDNQIGTVALAGGRSTLGNVGRAVHTGVEASVVYDLLARRGAGGQAERPALEVYANAMLLHAKFESGPQMNRTPQLAPDYVARSGLVFRRGSAWKVALLGTFVDRAFGDDGNTAERVVPRHAVLDLTAEARIPHTPVRLVGGINNLLDEDYYSRVTNSGIDPAPRRNVYVGAALSF